MNETLNYKNSILVLYELLYCPSSIEFVGELIEKIKSLEEDNDELILKKKVANYISFILDNDMIFIKKGEVIFDKEKKEEFLTHLNNNWTKFIDKNNSEFYQFWYGYSIEYTNNWIMNLKDLNLIKI